MKPAGVRNSITLRRTVSASPISHARTTLLNAGVSRLSGLVPELGTLLGGFRSDANDARRGYAETLAALPAGVELSVRSVCLSPVGSRPKLDESDSRNGAATYDDTFVSLEPLTKQQTDRHS